MKTAPLILLCNHRGDSPAELVDQLSVAGHRVETTRNLRGSLDRIDGGLPDLIVVRPLVRGGLVELEAIDRARAGAPPIPLLVVADRDSTTPALLAANVLGAGAWDMIYEDSPREELRLRVTRLEAEVRILSEMQDLRHRASHDDRTDLLRAQAFEARAHEHFSAAQRHGFDLALVLVDLDAFGAVNKQHDHTVGDILIAQVGEVIRRTLRTEDVAGRLGGDEFGVVLPYTRKLDAARVVSRLRDEIHKLSGRPAGAQSDVVVSASIGYETCSAGDIDSVGTLRNHAERALREAKDQGGNRAVHYRTLAREAPPED